jgi:hypothetical protein
MISAKEQACQSSFEFGSANPSRTVGEPANFVPDEMKQTGTTECPEKFAPTEGWGKTAEAEICWTRANSIRMAWTPNFELHLNGSCLGRPAHRPVFPLSIVELTFARIDHETICRWALS